MKRAKDGSDEEDAEDGTQPMNAVQLANRAMEIYCTKISNLIQLDVHGNDLRLPQLQRKIRKFMECFGEVSSSS